MKRMLTVSCLVYTLTACSGLMRQTPVVETVILETLPSVTFTRARTALLQMTNKPIQADAASGTLSGEVHNAVALNITVHPHPAGSLVTARGSLLPNKLVLGSFTEVQDYLRLVQQVP